MAESKYQFDDPKAAYAEAERRIWSALRVGRNKLFLNHLGLTELPESLGKLTHLQVLRLNDNQLETLPERMAPLTHLRELNLGSNKLAELPALLGHLTQLEELVLSYNKLTELPAFLDQLIGLQLLYVAHNRLTRAPEFLGRLSQLHLLRLDNNQLTILPESLRKLTALRKLYLHGNDALGLPPEVLGPEPGENVHARPADILDYYFRLLSGKRPLNEAKLVLLGRGEVGKTCVVNRLIHDKFKRTGMTRGIAITQWLVTSGKDTVRLHVWDFGGQEIQHATHQFFLTERSLYLVVLNGRAGAEDEDAEYWLKFVKTFGASSPTIVVLNKFKAQPFQVNRRGLQAKYPFIRAFVETDCEPGIGTWELKREIESALEAMEHVWADFPAGWFKIKERLAKMKEPFISFAEYRKICAALGENDAQAQERLARFLDDLGIALNYLEDPQLREATVLNPHWITEGVYQIITSNALAERHGELRLTDLASILPKKAYPPRMHGFLIELMRKFELCFLYHDDPKEHRYLVPELLGKEEPALKEPFPPGECLNFRYEYRLMPEGLLPRFITRTHTMSEPSERWRTGVVLRWEGCRALVKADKQERQVLVRVLGEPEKRRRLLAVIRENFDQIHAEMKEFKPTEWVALDGHPESWISYSKLETFEQNRKPEFDEPVDSALITVNVNRLLEQTDVPGARERGEARAGAKRPLKLFISYAREDERWRARLKPNLELLEREGLIEIWSDQQIVPGMKWDDEIKRKLEEAELYLFLMSTHLLISEYVRDHELPAALQRYEAKKAGLVPVAVQRCNWKKALGQIQGLPSDGRPVCDWRPYDNACFDVEEGLRKTIAEVRKLLTAQTS